MELSREQGDRRLRSPSNLANRLREFRNQKKKAFDVETGTLSVNTTNNNLPRLPTQARSDIIDKLESGEYTGEALAAEYGVSRATVSRLKQIGDQIRSEEESRFPQEPRLQDKDVRRVAIEKMMLAMGLITEDKLADLKAKDLSVIASNTSKVLIGLNDKAMAAPQVNLVVYAPEIRSEQAFKVVEIESEIRETPDRPNILSGADERWRRSGEGEL